MGIKAKQNPFSSEKVEQLTYRPTGISIDELMSIISHSDYRGAIVGPHGSGKTTLMEQLSQRLSDDGHKTINVFVNDTIPMTTSRRKDLIKNLRPCDIVMLDGADLIGTIAWQTLKRGIIKANAGLIITTHKHGMMTCVSECSTTLNLLTDIANELLTGIGKIQNQLADEIFSSHKGNIRNCLWQMYDIWATEGKTGLIS